VAVEAPREAGYEALGLPLIHAAPEHAGKGPLAGLAAGLSAAPAGSRVVFAPSDMPLLEARVFDALLKERGGVYAACPNGVEPLVAVLEPPMLPALLTTLSRDQLPRTHVALDDAGAHAVMFADAAPFANVNTPADLARLSGRRL
jgi:molybdopterin-guanine dinucleotide biosynthesis protein A